MSHIHFWEISFSTEGKFTNLHILIPFVSVVSVFICQKETGRGRWASTNGLEEGEWVHVVASIGHVVPGPIKQSDDCSNCSSPIKI